MTAAPSDSWKRLHDASQPAAEKLCAAAALLAAPGADERTAIWLFEWLCGSDGVWSKKKRLTLVGLNLLCDLLKALPPLYPLGSQTPLLVGQMRGILEKTTATTPAEAAAGGEGTDSGETASTEVIRAHALLVSLLLGRSVLSFRLTPEQAVPLFLAAVQLLERTTAEDDSPTIELLGPVAELVVGTTRLLLGALESVGAKKAFKNILDVFPMIGRLLARIPDEVWTARKTSQQAVAVAASAAKAGEIETVWSSVLAAARACIHELFDQRNLPGIEALARVDVAAKDSHKDIGPQLPAAKRAKTDGGVAASHGSPVYQAGLFKCVGEFLTTPGGVICCHRLLPILFDEFVTENRRLLMHRSAMSNPTGTEQRAMEAKKRQAPGQTTGLPLEFWFFKQLSKLVRSALQLVVVGVASGGPNSAGGSEDIAFQDNEASLIRCLVELWRLVRARSVYRPREDPDRVQAKALASFCQLLLDRLGQCQSAAVALDAPEWDGLAEALQLDPSPFEKRLDQAWSTIGDLCPRNGANSPTATLWEHDKAAVPFKPAPCIALAVALLSTYARLSDLPTCMSALRKSLAGGGPRRKRAKRLLSSEHLLRAGVQAAVFEVSAGSAFSQTAEIWEALLGEVDCAGGRGEGDDDGRGDEESQGSAVILLQHFLLGLRVTELSLQPLRSLLLRTFSVLLRDGPHIRTGSKGNTGNGRERPHADGLLLAACCFGRQLGAWELPSWLQPTSGDGAKVARRSSEGLESLVRRFLELPEAETAAGDVYVQAAVQWLSLREQERESGFPCGTTFAKDPTEHGVVVVTSERVLERLLALAQEHTEARRALCTWAAPMFVAQAVRGPGASIAAGANTLDVVMKDGEGVVAAESSGLQVPHGNSLATALARVFVPSEAACWRQMARFWDIVDSQEHEDHPQSFSAASLLTAALSSDKSWAPAAQLWAGDVEVLREPPPALRAPLLTRFACLIEKAAAPGGGGCGSMVAPTDARETRRRQLNLLGLVEALSRLTAASPPPKNVPTEPVFAALRAVAATMLFLQAVMVGGGDGSVGGGCRSDRLNGTAGVCKGVGVAAVSSRLLVASVRCMGQLVATLAASSSLAANEAPQQSARVLVGDASGDYNGGALNVAVRLLANGAFKGHVAVTAAAALAGAARSLFRLHFTDWPESERRPWAAAVLDRLMRFGLQTRAAVVVAPSADADATPADRAAGPRTLVTLPSLRELLGPPRETAADAENRLADTEQSLRLLLAVLEGSCIDRDRAAMANHATPTFGQGVTVVFPTDSFLSTAKEAERLFAEASVFPRSCLGLSLAVIARCVELGGSASGSSGRVILELDDGASTAKACNRSRLRCLVDLVAAIVRLLGDRPDAGCRSHCEEAGGWGSLRRGASAAVLALSAAWPDDDEEELWRTSWAPLVVAWSEALAVASRLSAHVGLDNGALVVAVAKRAGGIGSSAPLGTPSAACCTALCASGSNGSGGAGCRRRRVARAVPAEEDGSCGEAGAASCASASAAAASAHQRSRNRREHVVELLAGRIAALATRTVDEYSTTRLLPLLGVAGGLAAVLNSLPPEPPLGPGVASRIIFATRGLCALVAAPPSRGPFGGDAVSHAAVVLSIGAIARALYALLAAPQQQLRRGDRGPRAAHYTLGAAEALLLHAAGMQTRTALQLLQPGTVSVAREAVWASAGAAQFAETSLGEGTPTLTSSTTVAPAHVASSELTPSLSVGKERSLVHVAARSTNGHEIFSALLSCAYGLYSALFSSVPPEGRRLPTWTQKPHIVVDGLKLMIEAVYASPTGSRASAIAADVTRLWEAFTQGGTRVVTRSAGRTGQSTYQAKVQRANQGFVIMIIGHALEQQRRWAGVDAAVQRSLLLLKQARGASHAAAPKAAIGASTADTTTTQGGLRAAETTAWKETVGLVQLGMASLLESLEGADHLKQGLYVALREPVNAMFREVHEAFQKRTRYKGEA
eukprot:TRINITY_DN61901_c0_g1_i1.p1 TRINITY_DN61901_c0_g1~~TRINITY_DN61901_c0_g1_i1.p1  ORF type:complete len:2002 (-),score=410.30 TRINITY_DN61901_c0_g1_i1:70-5976(-)